MAKIGFIGLGHMGLPMAKNLIKADHNVIGFDLEKKALQELCKAGGKKASSILELASNQDVLITMLQTGKQVMSVCMGDTGLFTNASKNTLFIDCSTIDVLSSQKIHQEAIKYELLAVDAPVSGGVAGAADATLTFMVGGTFNAFQAAQKILLSIGNKIIHTGDASSGQAAKICNNMILGISMIAVSEAFILGKALGLTDIKLHEVVENASGQCWVMDKYVPVPGVLEKSPANNDYNPGFSSKMMLKDLQLSQLSANTVNITTEMGSLATKIYQKAIENGNGDKDFSAIIKESFL